MVAAAVGKRLLDWLAGPRAAGLQIGMSLLIVLVGVILTISAVGEMMQFEGSVGAELDSTGSPRPPEAAPATGSDHFVASQPATFRHSR